MKDFCDERRDAVLDGQNAEAIYIRVGVG